MKPVDVKDNILLINKLIIKILNLKLMIMQEYQNTKTFLLKDILQTGLNWFLHLKKSKILFHVISDLNSEEIVGTFYEKELQKTNQKEFRIEKVIKKIK